MVNEINDYMLSLIPQDSVTYYSSDSISKTNENCEALEELYDTEFLNTINSSEVPPHKLALKIGVPIMLLRNIGQAAGRIM